MSEDCIFCKIVAGELPCSKVYEDDELLAFMDIGPIIKGHTLVIPKKHYDPLIETPLPVLEKIIALVQRIARAHIVGLNAQGLNVTQANGSCAGQAVPHIHFHVIPRFETDGHSWNWRSKRYENPDEMEAFADRIRKSLE